MDYNLLLTSLEGLLGKSHKRARENHAFHCPFCNHHKPKLEIQLVTSEKGENPWECWVCHTRGRTIHSLLKQLNTPVDVAQNIHSYVRKGEKVFYKVEDVLELPKEYRPLYDTDSSNIIANKVKKYLYKRGLNDYDFRRYNIGYCTSGDYSGRVIIPSYDADNKLNFFISRTFEDSYLKYKNPPFSRDIIFFENMINWNLPIIIVEGVFDAITTKSNSIPILGKTMSKSLIKRILSNEVKKIYVCLDKDALRESLSICNNLLDMGKEVYLIQTDCKDPSELGYVKMQEKINQAQELTVSELIKFKLEL